MTGCTVGFSAYRPTVSHMTRAFHKRHIVLFLSCFCEAAQMNLSVVLAVQLHAFSGLLTKCEHSRASVVTDRCCILDLLCELL